MFQLSGSIECRIRDTIVTVALGWGVATFPNLPWYKNLFGIIRQGALGIARYGFIFGGFFVTVQGCDLATVTRRYKPITPQKPRTSSIARNLRAGSSMTPPQA